MIKKSPDIRHLISIADPYAWPAVPPHLSSTDMEALTNILPDIHAI